MFYTVLLQLLKIKGIKRERQRSSLRKLTLALAQQGKYEINNVNSWQTVDKVGKTGIIRQSSSNVVMLTREIVTFQCFTFMIKGNL